LADAAQRLKMTGEVRTAAGDADPRARAGDGPDYVAAKESRATVNGYQCSIVQFDAHGSASSLMALLLELDFADATCHERGPP
jgi:hypothetical protein